MPINFFADINLDKQQIQSVAFETLGANPAAPVEGQFYFNTVTDRLRFYDLTNTTWIEVGNSTGVTSVAAQNGLEETGTAASPVIEPDYSSASNIILSAGAATTLTTSSTFIASVGNSVEQYTISNLATLIGAGVSSFTNVDGTFISAGTVNTAATGAVTMGTIDLSATGSTDDTTFLRGDNTWSTISQSSTYAADIGGATTITVTHSLNTLDVIVQLYDISNGQTVFAVVDRTGVNAVNIVFSTAPGAGAIRCLISAI
jgi:hypothetical protein